ncbi:MAG: phenylalanine--tRNA ligase subunit beta [Cellulomonadaceae bacterium]|jgi:phenylalanyl-tRNA synthetase beta chain|nr:phenylalanine--tRNA ligase subunit beta [Cellulomonadaceae bacterium]
MPLVVTDWLADHVELPANLTTEALAEALVRVGLEEETIHPAAVTGNLVVGRVLSALKEPQKNGKTINWCRVDVGPAHNDPAGPDAEGVDQPAGRGIICGAHNFEAGDLVVVALPGTVLPGPFPIAARKTYGHVSDGMICSTAELGLGDDGSHGIIVLGRDLPADGANPGDSAIDLLGLGDEVLEINVTPDRGYAFSYRGVAREYALSTGAAFTDRGLAALNAPLPAATADGFAVVVDDKAPIHGQAGCDRFVTRIVRGIDPTAATPAWMKRRLEGSGMRSISLAVDVTNYVMLDLGQPLHAYDLAKLAAPIVVRRAAAGERLTTLDDVDRALNVEDLLITDSPAPDGKGSRVLGLAGVMGGASSEVTAATTDVLVEAAHFDPITVARTARRHKLPSEAAKRFERGVDPLLPAVAAARVVDLLVEYGGGTADAAVSDLDATTAPAAITLPLDLPSRIVGVDYSAAQVTQVLEQIGCTVSAPSAGTVTVIPPSWRPDLTEAVTLVEEVVRIAGYDAIPSVVPAAPGGKGLTAAQRIRRSVARTLAEAGLVETLSYPFIGEADLDALGLPADDVRRQAVRLANPLADDRPLMRTNLLVTLVETARRNVARGLPDVAVSEMGLVTTPGVDQPAAPALPVAQRPCDADLAALHAAVPAQPRHVAAVIAGRLDAAGWWGGGRVADWADALKLASLVADRAGVRIAVEPDTTTMPWHPGRCARLTLLDGRPGQRTVIGQAGELHPKVVEGLGLPARTVAFEVNLSALEAAASAAPTTAKPVSAFPAAKEDFAFVVDADVSAETVRAAVAAGAGKLLEDVTLFDVFTGAQVGEGKKSLAYSVRLRGADKTLTADEIREARNTIVKRAEKAGASLRA